MKFRHTGFLNPPIRQMVILKSVHPLQDKDVKIEYNDRLLTKDAMNNPKKKDSKDY